MLTPQKDASDRNSKKYKQQLSEENALLLSILQGTSHLTGADFFKSLVKELAIVLNTYGALVADYLPDVKQLRPRAYWLDGDWVEPGAYDTAGTPCEEVIEQGNLFQIPDLIFQYYPDNQLVIEQKLMSYTGMPFKDKQGKVIGHIAVFDSKPITNEVRFMALFEIFGARAAAEMRRIRAEEEIREREEQLRRLIEGAMDGIIDFDDELNIHLINQSALDIFHAAEAKAQGTSLRDWLTADSVRLIQKSIHEFCQAPTHHRHAWIRQGLQGRRRSEEDFQIEATLSHSAGTGRTAHTLILRDTHALHEAEEKIRHLQQEAELMREELQALHENGKIIGDSKAIKSVFSQVSQVATTDATVLLTGDTGSGKEIFARAIHQHSRRKAKRLVTVNCAAIPRELVESEFFGHAKGAFSGAATQRDGRFLYADGGTIFLDEVAELPLDVQAKLLRVLQESEFEPVGSSQMYKVDVRVIAATNRNLAQAVKQGLFREDLYYRLNVFPIHIPPLKDRGRDILLLADYFAERIAKRIGRPYKPVSEAYVQRLLSYDWPGNVRELKNIIEYAVITSQDNVLRPEVTLQQAPSQDAQPTPAAADTTILTAEEMHALQRDNIRRALEICNWRIAGSKGAARLLNLSPSTLRSRIQSMGIQRQQS
jgi:PAS domain S-box-containing protein